MRMIEYIVYVYINYSYEDDTMHFAIYSTSPKLVDYGAGNTKVMW